MDQAADAVARAVEDTPPIFAAVQCNYEAPTESSHGGNGSLEPLNTRISELEQLLHSTEAKLLECQQENRRKKKVTFVQALQNDDVLKLTDDYSDQIRKLKDKLNCIPGSSDAKRLADENEQLKKKNCVLLHTNTCLTKIILNLEAKVTNTSKSEHHEDQQAANSKSLVSPTQCHPGRDVGAVPNSLAMTEKCPTVKELQRYPHDYWMKTLSLNSETVQLKQQIQNYQRFMIKQEEAINKLVEERDKLRMEADDPQKFKDLVVKLQKENDELRSKLSHNYDHLNEQRVKIEKLMLRCTEAHVRTRQEEFNTSGEIEHLENCLEERNKQISKLYEMLEDHKEQLSKLKIETEELKNQGSFDTNIAFKEQLKTFQDDWFAEREEKQRIMKQLQGENESLMFELRRYDHQFATTPGSNPSLGAMPRSLEVYGNSLPHLDFPPGQGQQFMLHAQTAAPNSRVFAHQAPHFPVYNNTIPPRRDLTRHLEKSTSNQCGTNRHPTDPHQYYQMCRHNGDVPLTGSSHPMYNTDLHSHGCTPRTSVVAQNQGQSQNGSGQR